MLEGKHSYLNYPERKSIIGENEDQWYYAIHQVFYLHKWDIHPSHVEAGVFDVTASTQVDYYLEGNLIHTAYMTESESYVISNINNALHDAGFTLKCKSLAEDADETVDVSRFPSPKTFKLSSKAAMYIPRCWWHEESEFVGDKPFYSVMGKEEWHKLKAELQLVPLTDEAVMYRPEGQYLYEVNGKAYIVYSPSQYDKMEWLIPVGLADQSEVNYPITIRNEGKFITGWIQFTNDEKRYFLISTEHQIELSSNQATWDNMRKKISEKLAKTTREEQMVAIRDGELSTPLSLQMCREAGFCINGTREFLREKMPFVARLIQGYSSWSSVPDDIMSMVQEVQLDWSDYSSYLNRL
jgi:hypothetical protein